MFKDNLYMCVDVSVIIITSTNRMYEHEHRGLCYWLVVSLVVVVTPSNKEKCNTLNAYLLLIIYLICVCILRKSSHQKYCTVWLETIVFYYSVYIIESLYPIYFFNNDGNILYNINFSREKFISVVAGGSEHWW